MSIEFKREIAQLPNYKLREPIPVRVTRSKTNGYEAYEEIGVGLIVLGRGRTPVQAVRQLGKHLEFYYESLRKREREDGLFGISKRAYEVLERHVNGSDTYEGIFDDLPLEERAD